MKLDLLTNATVVDDVIRFVEEKSKDKNNNETVQKYEAQIIKKQRFLNIAVLIFHDAKKRIYGPLQLNGICLLD
jgi:hypothetical protein